MPSRHVPGTIAFAMLNAAPLKVRAEPVPRRPGCGETRMVEWDAGLQHFFCGVCSRTWVRPS